MKRILLIFFILTFVLPLPAQRRNTPARKATVVSKTTKKKKTTTTKRKTSQKVDKKTQLRNEHAATQKKRKQSQAQLAKLNKSVKANLDSVMILDHQIGKHQLSIDSLNSDIVRLSANIDTLKAQYVRLTSDLEIKKKRYAKAIMHARRMRSVQSKIMFVFSAENFSQIVRRIRYLREYSTFQKAQGELIKQQQAEVKKKQNELLEARAQKESSLNKVEETKKSLQGLKTNCQTKVDFLNKNIATVQQQIKQYQQREEALNAEIDRIVQAEIEAARRAEKERKRKAEEARQKAEEEAKAKARRLAEAKNLAEKAREAEAKARKARKAAKTDAERAEAEAAEKKAKADIKAADEDVRAAEAEEKESRRKVEAWKSNDSSADAKLSTNFTSNKGRLPIPITGSYNIVGHYGTYTVAGLSRVTLNKKGIDIRGHEGASARAVFNGVVSSIFNYNNTFIVMLRHGSYISVYSGLQSVSVSKGQKVSTKDILGPIAKDSDGKYILHFQLRKEKSRLNPEAWIRR